MHIASKLSPGHSDDDGAEGKVLPVQLFLVFRPSKILGRLVLDKEAVEHREDFDQLVQTSREK